MGARTKGENSEMENAVVSSVLRDAAVARVTQRGALKAGSLFGLGLIASGFATLLVAILIAGADPSGLAFIGPMISIVSGLTYAVARHGRWAQGLAAVASLALIGMLVPVVGHAAFDSFFDFVPVALCLTGAVTVIGFAGADLARRELSPSTTHRAG